MLSALGLSHHQWRAPAANRHRLRPVHLPGGRPDELRLLPGCPLPGGDAVRHHVGPRRRRASVIGTPLIGLAQDGLCAFEPAFVDELAAMLRFAFDYMQRNGTAIPTRRPGCATRRADRLSGLSTRPLEQPSRPMTAELTRESSTADTGCARPAQCERHHRVSGRCRAEAITATGLLAEDRRDVGLLAITSADRLNAGHRRPSAPASAATPPPRATSSDCLPHFHAIAGIVSVSTAIPQPWHGSGLSWPPGQALGVEHFGQTGTIADLYRHHGIDANAIVHAAQAVSTGREVRYLKALAD